MFIILVEIKCLENCKLINKFNGKERVKVKTNKKFEKEQKNPKKATS